MMLGVVWMFQLIAFIFLGLRLYTRLVVINNYGWDDHFFNLSVVRKSLFNFSAPGSPLPLYLSIEALLATN